MGSSLPSVVGDRAKLPEVGHTLTKVHTGHEDNTVLLKSSKKKKKKSMYAPKYVCVPDACEDARSSSRKSRKRGNYV